MEAYREKLTKKTTVRLQPELHRRLTRLANQRRTSIGELIRSAVVLEREIEAVCSYDRAFDPVVGLLRVEP